MCSLFCEHFCPEAFPYLNRKFIKRRYSGNEGDTGRSGNPEIELFSNPLIRNISYPMRQAGRTFYVRFCFLPDFLAEVPFTIWIGLIRPTPGNRKFPSKWSGHFVPSGPLTLYHKTRSFPLNANSYSL